MNIHGWQNGFDGLQSKKPDRRQPLPADRGDARENDRQEIDMRRKDRELLDPARAEAILQAADCCRLAFADSDKPYIVPMSFGFAREGGKLCLYFHSAPAGQKIELIEALGKASFEADTGCQIKTGAEACEFSCYYESVVGYGNIKLLQDDAEKRHALRVIMAHYTGKQDWEFPPRALAATCCIRLTVEEMTAKANRPPAAD